MYLRQDLIVIAVSIALGLIFYRRTGVATGGIISPGLLALGPFAPRTFAFVILSSLLVLSLLEVLVRVFGLYGRERVSFALLIAALLGFFSSPLLPWVGWVVPGLIAADMQRQGVIPTTLALFIVTGLSVLMGNLVYEIF